MTTRARMVLLIVMAALLLSGCSLFGGKKSIKVVWENVPAAGDITSLSSGTARLQSIGETPIFGEKKGYEIALARSPLYWMHSEITATLYGGGNGGGEFDFEVDSESSFSWERISGNKIKLDNTVSGSGNIVVTHDDLIATVPFVVFSAGGIANEDCWFIDGECAEIDEADMWFGYSFADESPALFEEGDIQMIEGSTDILVPYGYAFYPRHASGDSFLDRFRTVADVSHLTFGHHVITQSEAFDYIFFIRTKEGGYVKLEFMARLGRPHQAWGFIYDYSPDGVFETY